MWLPYYWLVEDIAHRNNVAWCLCQCLEEVGEGTLQVELKAVTVNLRTRDVACDWRQRWGRSKYSWVAAISVSQMMQPVTEKPSSSTIVTIREAEAIWEIYRQIINSPRINIGLLYIESSSEIYILLRLEFEILRGILILLGLWLIWKSS